MTKPVVRDPMYQCVVEVVGKAGVLLPVGPRMTLEAVECFCMTINRLVSEGKERTWANAHPVRMQELAA